jgi:tRNA pseudouridine55 synthase
VSGDAERLAHGIALPVSGQPGPVAVFAPDGSVVALVEDRDGKARPLCVLVG